MNVARNSLEVQTRIFTPFCMMVKKLFVPVALPPGSAEGGQPTPTSCYAETTAVLRVGVVEVPLCTGAAAAAAAGPLWYAVVVGPPIRVLSFEQTVTQEKTGNIYVMFSGTRFEIVVPFHLLE
jgi:hypothetical protein